MSEPPSPAKNAGEVVMSEPSSPAETVEEVSVPVADVRAASAKVPESDADELAASAEVSMPVADVRAASAKVSESDVDELAAPAERIAKISRGSVFGLASPAKTATNVSTDFDDELATPVTNAAKTPVRKALAAWPFGGEVLTAPAFEEEIEASAPHEGFSRNLKRYVQQYVNNPHKDEDMATLDAMEAELEKDIDPDYEDVDFKKMCVEEMDQMELDEAIREKAAQVAVEAELQATREAMEAELEKEMEAELEKDMKAMEAEFDEDFEAELEKDMKAMEAEFDEDFEAELERETEAELRKDMERKAIRVKEMNEMKAEDGGYRAPSVKPTQGFGRYMASTSSRDDGDYRAPSVQSTQRSGRYMASTGSRDDGGYRAPRVVNPTQGFGRYMASPMKVEQPASDENALPVDPDLTSSLSGVGSFGSSSLANPSTPSRFTTTQAFSTTKVPLKAAHASPVATSPQDIEMLDADDASLDTPTRTRPDLNPKLLEGVRAIVDVHTSEGEDASFFYTELLGAMGAQVFKTWPKSFRNVPTHVIFKDGSKQTLKNAKEFNVDCYSAQWVLDCEKENRWVDESEYVVDRSIIPRGGRNRRKSMVPQPVVNNNGTLSTPMKTSSTSRESRRDSTIWTPGNTEQAAGEQEWSPLSPVPKTPSAEAIHQFAMNVSPGTPSASPWVPDQEDLLTRTAPSKRLAFQDMPVFDPEHVANQRQEQRLLAARRASLQHAPKVSSPLARQWR
ncbi:hypothetical protein F4780DRAFT_739344 [Xylariomycetidae sp. FL0641]|nr:hypothetical protein F4780DRAFT_739344 [Xylariomycetidae sp. FL0641]